MVNSYEFVNKFYNAMWKQPEFCKLMGNPSTPQERNARIVRGLAYLEPIQVYPFMIVWADGRESSNMHALNYTVHVRFYTQSPITMQELTDCVGKVMESFDVMKTDEEPFYVSVKGVYAKEDQYEFTGYAD